MLVLRFLVKLKFHFKEAKVLFSLNPKWQASS